MFNFFKKKKVSINKEHILEKFKVSINQIDSDLFLKTTPGISVYSIKSINGFIDENTILLTLNDAGINMELRVRVNEIDSFLLILNNDAKNFKKMKSSLIKMNYKIILKYD